MLAQKVHQAIEQRTPCSVVRQIGAAHFRLGEPARAERQDAVSSRRCRRVRSTAAATFRTRFSQLDSLGRLDREFLWTEAHAACSHGCCSRYSHPWHWYAAATCHVFARPLWRHEYGRPPTRAAAALCGALVERQRRERLACEVRGGRGGGNSRSRPSRTFSERQDRD